MKTIPMPMFRRPNVLLDCLRIISGFRCVPPIRLRLFQSLELRAVTRIAAIPLASPLRAARFATGAAEEITERITAADRVSTERRGAGEADALRTSFHIDIAVIRNIEHPESMP